MNTNKLSILFLLQKVKINKQGKCPIRCRMTYLQERHEFATGLFVNQENWYSKPQIAKPPIAENTYINTHLSLIKNKINQAFLFLQLNGENFSTQDIYSVFKGETLKRERSVLETYDEYNTRIKKLIGKDIEQVTYNKYVESRNHLKDFIKYKFRSNDIKLKDLKNNFLEEFDYYLKTEKGKDKIGLQQSTINKVIQRFRRIIKYALSERYIDTDPFIIYEAKTVKKKILFLSKEELQKLENHQFKTRRVHNIKELFVFCCYTGLPFKEMSRLKKSDIFTGFDNKLWISVERSKTDRQYKVPLLPKALRIINEFNDQSSDLVFPNISNQKFNEYLKEVAEIVGININLTHHVARKTFASTVLLFNDVPIKIVSELLGHAKISTTQESYGKVVQKKIGATMEALSLKLNNPD